MKGCVDLRCIAAIYIFYRAYQLQYVDTIRTVVLQLNTRSRDSEFTEIAFKVIVSLTVCIISPPAWI